MQVESETIIPLQQRAYCDGDVALIFVWPSGEWSWYWLPD